MKYVSFVAIYYQKIIKRIKKWSEYLLHVTMKKNVNKL